MILAILYELDTTDIALSLVAMWLFYHITYCILSFFK